jgi:hypothetical protein
LNNDLNVSLFPLRDPDILVSIRVSGSDIWPKGHLRRGGIDPSSPALGGLVYLFTVKSTLLLSDPQ